MPEPPDDDPPKIEEPPFDPETDTQPLKPLRPIKGTGDLKTDRARRPPPATILREAAPPPPPPLGRAALPGNDDTDRVRLVPRQMEQVEWRLVLVTTGRKPTSIGLHVRDTMVIGRFDPNGILNPDLDLSPYLAAEHGISRRHAALIPTPEALILTDLHSTNGTWLNGDYLAPSQRVALTPGDRLELGLLKLVVKSLTSVSREGGKSA